MKMPKKLFSALLASALIMGMTGCGQTGTSGGNEAPSVTTEDPDKQYDITSDYKEIAGSLDEVESKNEQGAGDLYESGKKAGEINVLCYYEFDKIGPECEILDVFAERFGGTVVQENLCSSMEYVERLGTLMASGQAPDIVRYEATMLPSFMINNRLTPLDGWLDPESPLWADMKASIDYYSLAGKHYYFPQERQTGYGIIYNDANIEAMGAKDPLDLYLSNEWTWDTFKDLLIQWQDFKEDAIGITSGSGAPIHFAATTGAVPIQYTGDDVKNNLRDANIMRAMQFLQDLYKEGLVYEDYMGPDNSEGWTSGNVLFFNFGCEWAVQCGQETLFRNDKEGTVKYVPMPRDPQADKYYQLATTYGYLIPAGATNIQGAVSWILAGRIYRTDPEIIEENRQLLLYDGGYYYPKCVNKECGHVFDGNEDEVGAVCPECGTARKAKFKLVYDEDQLQVSDDLLRSADKFSFLQSEQQGFGQDMMLLFEQGAQETLFDTPYRHGGSYTQIVESNYEAVESYLEPYRKAIAEANAAQ